MLKQFHEGTHRVQAPRETLEKLHPMLPEFGITRVSNLTGLDRVGIPVTQAVRPNARCGALSHGKGLSLEAAMVSAIMESVESWHAERITLPLKFASHKDLQDTHRLADVARLARPVTSVFHDALAMLWCEGRNLADDSPIWAPYEMVHTNFTLPLPPASGSFTASTNGLASGNHLLEAVSHGICELIERDAATLWTLRAEAETEKRRIDLTSIDCPAARAMLDRFDAAGVDVAVWDISGDIEIPVYHSLAVERVETQSSSLPASSGWGCHPNRNVALARALTESAQSRAVFAAGGCEDFTRATGRHVENADTVALLKRQVSGSGRRSFHDCPTFNGPDLDADVAWELEKLRRAGFKDVLLFDLTKPDICIAVARVIIPGLECAGFFRDTALGSRAIRFKTRQP